MVENWNLHRNPKIDPEFVHVIGENARLGDISSIMRAYEASVSSPIKNAILGDFLELVLIQVQKQKVDAEKGIIKLDRLLQQNELNFQLFAAIPAITVVWGLWRLLTRETHPFSAIHHQVRLQLRSVSILLNRNNIDSAVVEHRMSEGADDVIALPMSFEQNGVFVAAIVDLQKVARYLPSDVKDWFIEDLHELANPRYGVQQKLATVARMYGTYGFLSGLAK
jgi:nuclear control of ATPase protein 2